jgi:hypothetical protein
MERENTLESLNFAYVLIPLTVVTRCGANLLTEKPMVEALRVGKAKTRYALESSESYLVLEARPEKVFAVFIECVRRGFRGLCITREYPKKIQRQYDLGGSRIFWLKEREQTDENVVEGLLDLSLLIREFIGTKNSIVLLDGLEYLVSRHGFEPVYHFVQNMRNNISAAEAILLVSAHPKAFDKAKLALLSRELRIVEYPTQTLNLGHLGHPNREAQI